MTILQRLYSLSCNKFTGKLHNILSSTSRLPCARSVSLIPLKRYMKEDKFAEKDKVPDGYKIIYRAPMENYLKVSKIVSTGSAAFVSGLALFKFATENRYIQLEQEFDFGGLVAHDSDIWLFAAGFIAINSSIMLFITKYPLRIYKNEKKYLAIYEGLTPFGVNRFAFNKGEVKDCKHFLNPWSLITYKLKDKVSVLLLDYFKTPSEFHLMCGDKESK